MSTGANIDPAAALIAALGEVARLLESGDSEGASRAMADAVGRFPSLATGGLGADAVAMARQLLERCRAAETLLRRRLTDEMAQMGHSRRAQAAYR
jgi:hypothetical protein